MLCSAYDLGWVDEPDEALVEMPLDFMPGDPCPSEMPAGVRLVCWQLPAQHLWADGHLLACPELCWPCMPEARVATLCSCSSS